MGKLFIVATPIGNLQDITIRAIETLKSVDFLVCEDTRITSKLLAKYEIKKKMIAMNEFNEEQVIYEIISKLETQNIALVSDAGTPRISDPGHKLVLEAIKRGVKVIPIPGPSAVISALSAGNMPADKFVFLGFLPKSATKTEKILSVFKEIPITIAIYESPHRITSTLETIKNTFGDIQLNIFREMTKIYEEIYQDKISNILTRIESKPPKGEFVVLFSTKE